MQIIKEKFSNLTITEMIDLGQINQTTDADIEITNEEVCDTIESLLMKMPRTINVLENHNIKTEWTIITGGVYILAIKKFILEGFVLQNLKFYPELNGLGFEDLKAPEKRSVCSAFMVDVNIYKQVNEKQKEFICNLLKK